MRHEHTDSQRRHDGGGRAVKRWARLVGGLTCSAAATNSRQSSVTNRLVQRVKANMASGSGMFLASVQPRRVDRGA